MDTELGAMIVLTGFLTWLGYYMGTKTRNILLGLVGSLGWILFLLYERNNVLFGFAHGSFGDEIIIYICYAMMIIIPLVVLVRIRSEDSFSRKGYDISPDGEVFENKGNVQQRGGRGVMDLSNSEYRAYIRIKRNGKK